MINGSDFSNTPKLLSPQYHYQVSMTGKEQSCICIFFLWHLYKLVLFQKLIIAAITSKNVWYACGKIQYPACSQICYFFY
jgi:hypothetical protein